VNVCTATSDCVHCTADSNSNSNSNSNNNKMPTRPHQNMTHACARPHKERQEEDTKTTKLQTTTKRERERRRTCTYAWSVTRGYDPGGVPGKGTEAETNTQKTTTHHQQTRLIPRRGKGGSHCQTTLTSSLRFVLFASGSTSTNVKLAYLSHPPLTGGAGLLRISEFARITV
jgi:hypothetical protein